MKIITDSQIRELGISAEMTLKWIDESFRMKSESLIPPKISLHPRGDDFFNTMPCILPEKYHTYSVKVVNRIKGNHPSLKSKLALFDTLSGNMTALMDADWITSRRTDAVATLAIKLFRNSHATVYSLMGLGNIAHSVLLCMLEAFKGEHIHIRLLRYKEQAEKFVDTYAYAKNIEFEIVDKVEQLIDGSDVVISCITAADGIIESKEEVFKPGVLVVPVHTRGFQNCDLFFDKVFADDRGHVQGFKYFDRFKKIEELDRVLKGETEGRTDDNERILSYNIGLGLHDVVYAYHIAHMISTI